MDYFVDREEEMKHLESEYKQDSAAFVVIYGRRRVGKTALIRQFIAGKPSFYFLATEESIAENKSEFRMQVADFTKNELLESAVSAKWDLLFRELIANQETARLVLVIDEFQYLGKADKAFPSILQKIWDEFLSKKNVMLILCGSHTSMMEAQCLHYTSPLYGRRTGQIRLGQIPFKHYHEFFPSLDDRTLIEYYSVTGGVPKYIELFQNASTVYTAIAENILSRQSFLYEEPYFLLQNEVQEVGSYLSIVRTIASGNSKAGQIAAALEMRATSISKPLKILMDLDIIEREVPVTEDKPESSKKAQYKIKDNFIAFWFKFIFPNRSFIESGHSEIAMNRIKAGLIANLTGYVYENVCHERLWDMNAAGTLPFVFNRLGRWWGARDVEIDICAIDTQNGNDILFGECKFHQTQVMGPDVLRNLREKAAKVPWGGANRREWFILFSSSGYAQTLIDIAEAYGDVILA